MERDGEREQRERGRGREGGGDEESREGENESLRQFSHITLVPECETILVATVKIFTTITVK